MGERPSSFTAKDLQKLVIATVARPLLLGKVPSAFEGGINEGYRSFLGIEVSSRMVFPLSDPQIEVPQQTQTEPNFPLFFTPQVPIQMETSSLTLFEKP